MSKALLGAVEIGAAVGFFAVAGFLDPALLANLAVDKAIIAIGLAGIGMEAGAIASALTANRGMGVTTRQPAANRQVIYGEQRVGGVIIYESTTGGELDQYNYVIVLAGHPCNAIVNLYLDGRQVFWNVGSGGNTTQNGINFGGSADGTTRTGPDGTHYNFGGLVYCEARYGTQLSGDVITGLTANDPNWAATTAGNPYVGGCTYVYLKVEYDATMFPQLPEVRFTVQGKNNIYDPRTGTSGYSQNWALVFADVLTNTEYGAGFDMMTQVNQAQLIAAANLCDEQVTLAAGGSEYRYTANGHFDSATNPGDILGSMMAAAAARVSWTGGQWNIFPAAWTGPSFICDQTQLLATPEFRFKSFRDLFNEVRGTYIAPELPYAIAGNLYDSNGFYEGTLQNNFNYAWQATDYPAFLEDTTHGYATNQWLLQDSGNPLVQNISHQWVISCATAQRLAKLLLRRNRQRMSTTLRLFPDALQCQVYDVIQFSYPGLFTNKLFEVTGVRTVLANQDATTDNPPYWCVELDIVETDSTIYDWFPATDELSPATDLPFPSTTQFNPLPAPAPVTSLALTDSATTAVIGVDGVTRPRILASWTPSSSGSAAQVQIRYQRVGATTWTDIGTVDATTTSAYIEGVVQGQAYNVQARAMKRMFAPSTWTLAGPYTVSATYSAVNSLGIAPGLIANQGNTATVDSIVSGTSATIRVYGATVGSSFTQMLGSQTLTLPAATITGLSLSTTYYVIYSQATGTYSAVTNVNTTLADDYIQITGVVGVTTVNSAGTGELGGGGGRAG